MDSANEAAPVSKMTVHWNKIKSMATVLDIDKMIVHRHWNKVKDYYIGVVNAQDEESISACKKILNDPQPRLFEPGPRALDDEEPTSKALTLSFWLIRKLHGDVDLAERAMKVAIANMRALRKDK